MSCCELVCGQCNTTQGMASDLRCLAASHPGLETSSILVHSLGQISDTSHQNREAGTAPLRPCNATSAFSRLLVLSQIADSHQGEGYVQKKTQSQGQQEADLMLSESTAFCADSRYFAACIRHVWCVSVTSTQSPAKTVNDVPQGKHRFNRSLLCLLQCRCLRYGADNLKSFL